MSIKRPIKAPSEPITDSQLDGLIYPIVGSPKLDGFRCIVDEEPKTSSLKPWPNDFIRNELSNPIYHGFDGEIVVGNPTDPNVYHNTSGPVRRRDGQPDFKLYVFDRWNAGNYNYKERWLDWMETIPENLNRIIVLEQRLLNSREEVLAYEKELLEQGFEGAMIRSIDGLYKQGRCSYRDMNIFKRKPFDECEATIIECIEGLQNMNEQKENELGYMRRSSHKANKVPKGTLGAFRVKSKLWPSSFTVGLGEGYTNELKQDIWNRRDEYIGQVATIKYQKYGSRDAPRIPSVIKIRPDWDLS